MEIEKVEKKEKAREASRVIELTYAKQLEERKKQKEKELQQMHADKELTVKEAEDEEKRLLEYIESMLQEKWMASNPFKKSPAEYLKLVKSLSK